MPTFRHGRNTQFTIADTGATPRDISNTISQISFPRPVDTAETTAFGSAAKTYVPGLPGATIQIQGMFDATVDGYLSALLGFATASAFVYGPEGTTLGQVKYTGTVYVTSYQVQGSVSAMDSYTCDMIVSGAVTRGAY